MSKILTQLSLPSSPSPLEYTISAKRQLFYCVDCKPWFKNTIQQLPKGQSVRRRLSQNIWKLQNCANTHLHHYMPSAGKQLNIQFFSMQFKTFSFPLLSVYFNPVIQVLIFNYLLGFPVHGLFLSLYNYCGQNIHDII